MTPCYRQFIIFSIAIFLGVCTSSFLIPQKVSAQDFLPTQVEVLVACGDGLWEPLNGEACDPGESPIIEEDIGTSTCVEYDDINGDPFAGGNLNCLADCSDLDPTLCFTCGNDFKEEAEECDNNDFGGETCISFGFNGGSLFCTTNCQISTMNCEAMDWEGGLPDGGGGSHGGGGGGRAGFDPGSETPYETKVIAKGKAYPHSEIHILIDGQVIGIVEADAKADFYFETSDITPGVASFGFWTEDKDGLKSTLLTLTIRVISGAVTTVSGIYLSPSINIDKKSVRQGEDIKIYGHTVPETEVHIHINSEQEFIEKTNSKDSGEWDLVFNTTPLEEDFHIAKALFQVAAGNNIIKSGFSRSISFHVGKIGGEVPCPEADLNHDGKVNITDFSILLYYWGTDDACADQNQNGIVDLIDFSIMMYYWTG